MGPEAVYESCRYMTYWITCLSSLSSDSSPTRPLQTEQSLI